MLALEIQINESNPLVVGTEGFTCVHINRNGRYDMHSISVGGADDSLRYKWIDEEMQDGDRVLIRVVEVDKDDVSPPFKIEKIDRERMKLIYEKLKLELQDKQLL